MTIKRILHIIVLCWMFTFSALAQVNTDRILTIGRNALYFEDYVLSIQYFNQVVNAKPYLFEPYFFRGYAKYSLGDYMGAIEDCDKSLDVNPFFIDAYLVRGISKQAIGDYEGANLDFNKGLEYDFDNTSLMMNRGIGKLALEDFKGAIADFSQAIKEKSGFMLAYLNRGRAYLEMNDTIQALKDYDKAIDINPFHVGALGMRGALLAQLKEYEKAEEDYDAAIRMEPKESSLFINRALIRYFSNNLRGAIADYNTAIELDPNSLIGYYNRGLLRSQIGDANRAIDDFDKVLQIEPDNYTALLNRALLNIEIGNHFKALDDLDAIIAHHPDFPIAYYARSQCKQALNDVDGAALDYNTGYALEFEGEQARKKARKDKGDLALNPNQDDPKESRTEKDKDVRNYKKIIVLDEDDSDVTGFDNTIRGRIQYRNIAIDLEDDFALSYYPEEQELERTKYFSHEVERYNTSSQNPIFISSSTHALSKDEISEQFRKIDGLNNYLKYTENDKDAYFQRALHYLLVKDFSSSLNDLNRAIDLDPQFTLAYFTRGVVRYKMVEFIRSIEDISESDISLSIGNQKNAEKKTNAQKQERILDYDLIMSDYNTVEDQSKNFAYMYFNRGNLKATLKDFKAAIADYSLAIRYEQGLAEAYFNRGLTYIYIGETEKGNRDLSKAGELGLYKAYNVLKRYNANQK